MRYQKLLQPVIGAMSVSRILFSLLLGLLLLAVALVGLTISPPRLTSAQESVSETITSQASLPTVFNYQGSLQASGSPANGQYDFEFKLYDDSTAGAQIGATQLKSNVSVDKGLFTVYLDFGDVFTGDTRFIEIGVRRSGPPSQPFTTLLPRQMISPVPYALWAKNSGGEGTENTEIWRMRQYGCEVSSLHNNRYNGCVGVSLDRTMQPTFLLSFGAPSTQKTLKSIKFLLVRHDVPSGNITATLQILDFAGNVHQNLTTIDITTMITGTWVTFPIAGNPIILPDEHLSFYFVGSNLPPDIVSVSFDAEAEVVSQ